jgi:hypothetical protein
MSAIDSQLYDKNYFQYGCGIPYERNAHWLNFFGNIAQTIVQTIAPRTVLDAGCAMGFLVEGLRERGVEAFGIDVSDYALQQVRADLQPFCQRASVVDPLVRRYDLIVCIEVLEHLAAQESARAVENLCAHADDILFSSTPSDFKEATHFNVQPSEYWAELFARENFFRDVDFDASFVNPWAVRFRRVREPLPRIVRDYERRFSSLWKENLDLRDWTRDIRGKIARDEESLRTLSAQVDEKNRALETQLSLAEEKERALQAQNALAGEKERALQAQNALAEEKERALEAQRTLNAENQEKIRLLSASLEKSERENESLKTQIKLVTHSRGWRILTYLHHLRLWLFPIREKK